MSYDKRGSLDLFSIHMVTTETTYERYEKFLPKKYNRNAHDINISRKNIKHHLCHKTSYFIDKFCIKTAYSQKVYSKTFPFEELQFFFTCNIIRWRQFQVLICVSTLDKDS